MTGDPYQVALSYCNGQVLVHDQPDIKEAVADYADALQSIFEPSEEPARHVRQVTLIKYDDDRNPIQHIDSGIHHEDCEHRVTTV